MGGVWRKPAICSAGTRICNSDTSAETDSQPIAAYSPSSDVSPGVESIVIGVYRDKELRYAARVRAGFVPLTRREIFKQFKPLETTSCPFVNYRRRTPVVGGRDSQQRR